MELGGLDHEGERVFLLSTTHGAETHALAAAMAAVQEYQREPVVERACTASAARSADGANDLAAATASPTISR